MDAMLPPPRELAGKLAILLVVLWQVVLWVGWLSGWGSHGRGLSTYNAVGYLLCAGYVLVAAGLVVVLAQGVRAAELQPSEMMLFLVVVLSELLWCFAQLYWDYGTTRNFTIAKPLNHFEAIYFAVGTLTTVGTGTIYPKSDTARALQTSQMAVGFALVVFVIGAIAARYFSEGGRATPSPGSEDAP
jgi:hypothetical protein